MSRSVILVETGMGNVRSVARALERAGASVRVSAEPAVIAASDRIVVPGQGHFGDGARALRGPLGDAIRAHLEADRPYLGICLGMQLLFETSEEAPGERGLGVLGGSVVRFTAGGTIDGRPRKVPHMGWNQVRGSGPLDRSWLYFVHSYHCVPADRSLVALTAEYGEPVCAAVSRGAIWACQFHPEKSGAPGEAFLRRFVAGEPGGGS